jgi:putative glutamine amidotransferase
MNVNSYHHQAIKKLADRLTAMACAEDNIVEAVYDKEARFLWAVQFHPEFAYRTDPNSLKIFEAFVSACC